MESSPLGELPAAPSSKVDSARKDDFTCERDQENPPCDDMHAQNLFANEA